MAHELKQPPSAACLSASMRDLGYSLETAVADLIDNSISAGASSIDILVVSNDQTPLVAILDNGHGMSEAELLRAMRHGAVNPRQPRTSADLGRFGLGLKTASFSQCRLLTVASRKGGRLCGAEWNLDIIDRRDDWILTVLDEDDVPGLPFVERLAREGTIVIWRELDRLLEGGSGARADEIVNEKIEQLTRHLALVFHRFLSGDVKGFRRIAISINGRPIIPFDPFCRTNPATQVLPEETLRIGNAQVRMQPYVLPHHSRLSATEYDYYRDRSDFLSNQGVYVYRNGRLMAWSGWFRLVPKGEATKLARIQVDFPNSLDEAWTIDIKKSRAHPPSAVRDRLRQIIDRIVTRSVDVHRKRGIKRFSEVQAPFWERYSDHAGIRYAINAEHPLIASLRQHLRPEDAGTLGVLLDSIAAALPMERIYSDYSTDPKDVGYEAIAAEDATEKLRALGWALFNGGSGDRKAFLQVVKSTHLFDDHEDLVEKFIEEAFG